MTRIDPGNLDGTQSKDLTPGPHLGDILYLPRETDCKLRDPIAPEKYKTSLDGHYNHPILVVAVGSNQARGLIQALMLTTLRGEPLERMYRHQSGKRSLYLPTYPTKHPDHDVQLRLVNDRRLPKDNSYISLETLIELPKSFLNGMNCGPLRLAKPSFVVLLTNLESTLKNISHQTLVRNVKGKVLAAKAGSIEHWPSEVETTDPDSTGSSTTRPAAQASGPHLGAEPQGPVPQPSVSGTTPTSDNLDGYLQIQVDSCFKMLKRFATSLTSLEDKVAVISASHRLEDVLGLFQKNEVPAQSQLLAQQHETPVRLQDAEPMRKTTTIQDAKAPLPKESKPAGPRWGGLF